MKQKRFFKFLIMMLIFVFLCSYFVEVGGYYEYHLSYKKRMTEEQMKRFESDIREGKNVDMNDYLDSNVNDYSNLLTDKTSDINLKLNEYLKNFFSNVFKVLEKLVR